MSNHIGNNGGRLYSFGAQPLLVDCNFVVAPAATSGLGVTSLRGQGVRNVFMHTTATPGSNRGYLNPNPAVGYAYIQLDENYNRLLASYYNVQSPTSGSAVAINATALTVGNPYQIGVVGAGPSGSATITPVADTAGSLAGTYFTLYDSYGNTFVIWFYVTGVGGSAPLLGPAVNPNAGQRGLQYIQQTIASGSTAATIGAALVSTINLLPSGVVGTFAFTASGTTTVTVTSTVAAPLAGVPQDGNQVIAATNSVPVPIYFNITTGSATAASVWTDGSGNLYTVTTTLASGTLLKTSGVQPPFPSSGTLVFVSGTGSSTALTYSSAVAGLATGFTFALVNSNTNLNCWTAVGLPPGITPAVGASFIATRTGFTTGGGSSGTVLAPGFSGIDAVEIIGNANLMCAPSPTGASARTGGWILAQFLSSTSSSVTTPLATAPAVGSTVYLSFYVDLRSSPSNVGTNGT